MSRSRTEMGVEIPPPLLEELLAPGGGERALERRVGIAAMIRERADGRALDRRLLGEIEGLRIRLEQAREAQEQIRKILERYSTPPWHPVIFLAATTTEVGPRAIVAAGSSRRVVGLGDGVDLDALAVGDEIFLDNDLRLVVARSTNGMPLSSDTCYFEGWFPTGQLVARWRDEQVILIASAKLAVETLAPGDQLRFDRQSAVAFEKIEPGRDRRFFLNEVPNTGRECVGGQDANLDLVLSALTAALAEPEKAARYGLSGRVTILLVGPPGCGKTLIVRAAATQMGRLDGRPCRFAVVKPAEWESCWVSETERNIRNCFKALREASNDGPVVLFLDEIEAIGRIRGSAGSQHADRFLAALLTEIDGFADRNGVALVASTNRKDLVDAALLERISEIEIQVGRPDLEAARRIFDIHLPQNCSESDGLRQEVIEIAVSRLYSPNAPDSEICLLRFRDGKTRTVSAPELVSGRLLKQIAAGACRSAFRRECAGGPPGVSVEDISGAVAQAVSRLRSTLSPANCHAYLAGLPQDMDVVSVEPTVQRVRQAYRYYKAA